jgi:hypothetical protein
MLPTATETVPLLPCPTAAAVGDTESGKSGTATASVALTVCLVCPSAAVIVSGWVPVGVVPAVVIVSCEEPDDASELGVNLALAPAGNPLAERSTLPVWASSIAAVSA